MAFDVSVDASLEVHVLCLFGYETFFQLQNNLKILDPSWKISLDFWD